MTLYLYEDYQDEIRKTVLRFILRTSPHLFYQQEDLIQEATLKFLECTKEFNEDLGVPFKSFLRSCIKNHLTDYIRNEIKYNKAREAGKKQANGEEYSEEEEGVIPVRISPYQYQDEEEVYREKLTDLVEKSNCLTSVEKQCIILFEKYRGKVPKACREMKVTREAFYRILERATDKLKEVHFINY